MRLPDGWPCLEQHVFEHVRQAGAEPFAFVNAACMHHAWADTTGAL